MHQEIFKVQNQILLPRRFIGGARKQYCNTVGFPVLDGRVFRQFLQPIA